MGPTFSMLKTGILTYHDEVPLDPDFSMVGMPSKNTICSWLNPPKSAEIFPRIPGLSSNVSNDAFHRWTAGSKPHGNWRLGKAVQWWQVENIYKNHWTFYCTFSIYNYILMVTWLLIKNNYEPMIMQLPNCTINGLIGDLTLEHGDFMGFTMWIS